MSHRGTNETTIGVWYSVIGTGGIFQATLNNTLILAFSVYSGESCDALACVGPDEISSTALSLFPLDWETVEGEQYFIYVYSDGGPRKDNFDIIVEEVTRPENDQCPGAISLEINGRAIEGSTSVSSSEDDLTFCGDVYDSGFGGVWYTFTGTGALVLIGVNTEDTHLGLPFDSQISLYSGPSCDELTCVGGNDQDDGFGFSSSLPASTVEGETYYVLVSGWGDSRGDFSIEARGVDRPANDDCENSIVLEPFDTVAGATFFATRTSVDFESCGTSQGGNFSSPGVWYSVEGTGQALEVSLVASYDVQLTVFSGDCSDLTW